MRLSQTSKTQTHRTIHPLQISPKIFTHTKNFQIIQMMCCWIFQSLARSVVVVLVVCYCWRIRQPDCLKSCVVASRMPGALSLSLLKAVIHACAVLEGWMLGAVAPTRFSAKLLAGHTKSRGFSFSHGMTARMSRKRREKKRRKRDRRKEIKKERENARLMMTKK